MKKNEIEKIKALLRDHRSRHSVYQIENFIIRSQGDAWAQYKQALREIQSRFDEITNIREDKVLCAIEIGDLYRKAKGETGNKIKFKIMMDRKKRQLKSLKLDYENTSREIGAFLKIAQRLKKQIGEIDEEKRNRLEADSWFQRAKKIAAIDVLTNGGRLSRQGIEFLMQIPVGHQEQIIGILRSGRIENLLDQDPGFRIG